MMDDWINIRKDRLLELLLIRKRRWMKGRDTFLLDLEIQDLKRVITGGKHDRTIE